MHFCSAAGSAPETEVDVWYCCLEHIQDHGQRWIFDRKCWLTQINHGATAVVVNME